MNLISTLAVKSYIHISNYLALFHINVNFSFGSCSCNDYRLSCCYCCYDRSNLAGNVAFKYKLEIILDFRSCCNCSLSCCCISSEVTEKTCDCKCEACVVIESRLSILISLGIVLVIAVSCCRSAYESSVESICTLITVGISCTVMDLDW